MATFRKQKIAMQSIKVRIMQANTIPIVSLIPSLSSSMAKIVTTKMTVKNNWQLRIAYTFLMKSFLSLCSVTLSELWKSVRLLRTEYCLFGSGWSGLF